MKIMNTIPQLDTMSKPQLAVVGVITKAYKNAMLQLMYGQWFKNNNPDKWEDWDETELLKTRGKVDGYYEILESMGMDDYFDTLSEEIDAEWEHEEHQLNKAKRSFRR